MKQYITFLSLITLPFFYACNGNKFENDASGTFEATEVIVSAEVNGKIEQFFIQEGDILDKNQDVGYIDSTQLYLKKKQLIASGKIILARRPDIGKQIASLNEQIEKEEFEKKRTEQLLKSNAATQKQLDDINSRIIVLKGQLSAQMNTLSTTVNSLNEESSSVQVQIEQIEDYLEKSHIKNPIAGTVLTKYVEEKEMVTEGTPLYKIADTKNLFLRAYVIYEQIEKIKLGQEVTVSINQTQKTYKGTVSWISDKAEFTPKTIQTKDERENLVYAIKIAVKNTDDQIKIGMYGDVNF